MINVLIYSNKNSNLKSSLPFLQYCLAAIYDKYITYIFETFGFRKYRRMKKFIATLYRVSFLLSLAHLNAGFQGSHSAGSFNLKWESKESSDQVDFVLTTKVGGSNNIYAAVGFSFDQLMVFLIICKNKKGISTN